MEELDVIYIRVLRFGLGWIQTLYPSSTNMIFLETSLGGPAYHVIKSPRIGAW
jgi:hypothetical protein